jgi:enamine deaminase RidA (YjgF/YER057c/UK114 family)
MTDVYERLRAAEIVLPPCPRPVGSYAPGKIYGRLVFGSGQTPTRDGALVYKGRVGADLSVEDAYAAARLAALNCLSEFEAVCGDLRRVESVLKVNGYAAAEESFGEQPAVVNGASELLGEVFGEAGVHARTSIGVHSLPGGAPVEIELVASLGAEAVVEEER